MTRVYINGRFLERPVTGVERYASEIVRGIDSLCRERGSVVRGIEFSVLSPARVPNRIELSEIKHITFGSFGGQLWEQIELPRFVGSNILLNLCNLAPLSCASNVICFHDAHTYLIPDNFSWRFRAFYKMLQPLLCRRSKKWITISRYSAEQLQYFGVANRPPDAIIGNGSEHVLRSDPARSRISGCELPRNFVFALGSRARNKNLELIRAAARILESEGVATVIAGGSNSRVFADGPESIAAGVIDLGRVDDDDICYLYDRAMCFAFPSFYEGFGLPPIEAMARGCPVIASKSSALPEVLGAAALFCSPSDPQAWVDAVLRIRDDADLRRDLTTRGREQAARHSWRASARQLVSVIRDLV